MASELAEMVARTAQQLSQLDLDGAATRHRMMEEGWLELYRADPAVAAGAMFAAQGANLRERSPILDLVVGAELIERGARLPAALDDTAVLYPFGPRAASLMPVVGHVVRGRVRAHGVTLDGVLEAESLIVPVTDDSGATSVVAIEVATAELRVDVISGLDPDLAISEVRVDARTATSVGSADIWSAACDAGRRAIGHELTGVARAALDETVKYVGERYQFGRPIGSFQAVRHRLADVFVAVESAELALAESWCARDPLQTAIARGLATEAHALAARWCLQAHGAIGFTFEHRLHRLQRRGWTIDQIMGTGERLWRTVGARLVELQEIPRFGTLAGDE